MSRAAPALGQVSSIAVLRANAMGDYLVSEPALAALRAAAPQATITLLGGDFAASALAGRPGPVDEVVLIPAVPGLRESVEERADSATTNAFYERMRERRFDIAVQLHGGGRNSNPVVLALGAGFTVGLRAFDAPALDHTISYQYWHNEVLRYLEVVALIGAPPIRTQPHFEVLPSDREAARAVFADDGKPLVVLHPGATDPRRRWPADRFAAVADALVRRGCRVCVVGTEQEVDPVRDAVTGDVTNLSIFTDLSFPQLVGLIDAAVLLVGNDSGPRHLADAVGTPTVGIYWCGNMITTAPVSRERNRVHASWTTACPVCSISLIGEPFPARCCDTLSCVATVPVDVVLASAVELLNIAHRRDTSKTADAIRREAGAS